LRRRIIAAFALAVVTVAWWWVLERMFDADRLVFVVLFLGGMTAAGVAAANIMNDQ